MRPAQSGPCRARATKAEWDAYRRADYDGLRAEFGLPSCTNAEWSEQGDGWEP